MSRPTGLRTWIKISPPTLKHNYLSFRKLLKPSTKLMAVAKSNAYGHNLVEFSQIMEKLGADWIGVDSLVEAETLRENGVEIPILVLGYTLPERLKEAAQLNVALTVSHLDHLKALKNLHGPKPKIHLKIDTGLHRQGFLPEDINDIINYIDGGIGRNYVEGVYTHFANAKNPRDPRSTLKQGRVFERVVKTFRDRGFQSIAHASATGGTIIFPQFHYDLVRVGIGLYGHYPSDEIEKAFAQKLKLKPALTWKTIIGETKQLSKGQKIGYDLTEKITRDSKIAVCPIGYWHGFPRSLSGQAQVLVGGKRCKVLGRVSMDMIVVDATEVPDININNEVTIIGKQKGKEITAEEMAKLCGTTSYEILTRLNPLIRRIYD